MKQPEWQRILNAFNENGGILTPLAITNGLKINQYGRAISDLRRKGYNIRSEYLGTVNGVKMTRFVLEGKHEYQKPKQSAHEIAQQIQKNKSPQMTLL